MTLLLLLRRTNTASRAQTNKKRNRIIASLTNPKVIVDQRASVSLLTLSQLSVSLSWFRCHLPPSAVIHLGKFRSGELSSQPKRTTTVMYTEREMQADEACSACCFDDRPCYSLLSYY